MRHEYFEYVKWLYLKNYIERMLYAYMESMFNDMQNAYGFMEYVT